MSRYSSQGLVSFLERNGLRPSGIRKKDVEQARRLLPKRRKTDDAIRDKKARS